MFFNRNKEVIKNEVYKPIKFIQKELPTDCDILQLQLFDGYLNIGTFNNYDTSFDSKLKEYLNNNEDIIITMVRRKKDGTIIKKNDPHTIGLEGWVGRMPFYKIKSTVCYFKIMKGETYVFDNERSSLKLSEYKTIQQVNDRH